MRGCSSTPLALLAYALYAAYLDPAPFALAGFARGGPSAAAPRVHLLVSLLTRDDDAWLGAYLNITARALRAVGGGRR